MFNGLFGKKKQNAPQPAAPTDDFADAPNFKQVCQLVGYKPMPPIKEAGYFFVSKNFCCAVSNEGIIFGLPDEACHPYAEHHVIRPFQIASIENDDFSLTDNGIGLQPLVISMVNPDSCDHIFIPTVHLDEFVAAVTDCVNAYTMGGEHGYGGFQQM